MKLKTGDTVLIIAGKDRGKTGKIEAVLPAKDRVLVSGVNSYKKHVKPTAKNPQGGIIEAFRPIHVSNVMYLDPTAEKPTRLGTKVEGGEKTRVSKLTGKTL